MTQHDDERFRPRPDQLDAIVRRASARRRSRLTQVAGALAVASVVWTAGDLLLTPRGDRDSVDAAADVPSASPRPTRSPARSARPTPTTTVRSPSRTAHPTTVRPSVPPTRPSSTTPVLRSSTPTRRVPVGGSVTVTTVDGGWDNCMTPTEGVAARQVGDFCVSVTDPPGEHYSLVFFFQVCRSPDADDSGSLSFRAGQEVEFVVQGAGDNEVWRWTDAGGSAHVRSVSHGDCVSWRLRWAGVDWAGARVPDGPYQLRARSLATELAHAQPMRADFTVRRQPG